MNRNHERWADWCIFALATDASTPMQWPEFRLEDAPRHIPSHQQPAPEGPRAGGRVRFSENVCIHWRIGALPVSFSHVQSKIYDTPQVRSRWHGFGKCFYYLLLLSEESVRNMFLIRSDLIKPFIYFLLMPERDLQQGSWPNRNGARVRKAAGGFMGF